MNKVARAFIHAISVCALSTSVMASDIQSYIISKKKIPGPADITLSDYRLALVTDGNRVIAQRNSDLEWVVLDREHFEGNYILQRRSYFTTIESNDDTYLYRSAVKPGQRMYPDMHYQLSEANVSTWHNYDAVDDPSRSCSGNYHITSSYQVRQNTRILKCDAAGSAQVLMGIYDEPAYTRVNAQLSGTILNTQYNYYIEPRTLELKSADRISNLRLFFGTYGNQGIGTTVWADVNLGNELSDDPIDSVSADETEIIPGLQSYGSLKVFPYSEQKVRLDLGVKGFDEQYNSTWVYCYRAEIDEVFTWDTSDKNYIHPKEWGPVETFVECGMHAHGGLTHKIQTGMMTPSDYPAQRPGLFNALENDRVYLAVVEDKRRANFVSDTLNDKSWLFLYQAQTWIDIPVGLLQGENVEYLTEMIYGYL